MQDDKSAGQAPLLRIPLFPLPTVLVPGLVMPLVLFEPKYLQLAENLMSQDESERFFGIVKTMPKTVGTPDISINTVGTIAQVQSMELRDDGKWDMVTVGARKFRIIDLYQDLAYLTADIELLPEETELDEPDELTLQAALNAFDEYRELLGVAIQDDEDLPRDAQTLSYLITAAAMFSLEDKQGILEIQSTHLRLQKITKMLKREVSIISQLRCFPTFEPNYQISLN